MVELSTLCFSFFSTARKHSMPSLVKKALASSPILEAEGLSAFLFQVHKPFAGGAPKPLQISSFGCYLYKLLLIYRPEVMKI